MHTERMAPKFSAEWAADRHATIAKAIEDGKILPESYQHYSAQWDADPVGTKRLLASLFAAGRPAPVQAATQAVTTEYAYPPSMLTANERARAAGLPRQGGRILTDND